METNNTQNERVNELKRKGMPQEWKTAMAAAVGFVGGGGVAYAIENLPKDGPEEPVQTDEPEKPEVKVVEVVEVEHKVIHHYEPEPKPEPEPTSLPGYIIVEEEIVTTANGGQMHVAYGVTEEGHLCMLVDEDMDGMADTFYVDTNDNGQIDDGKLETISLTDNHIHVNMNYLPMAEIDDPLVVDDPVIPEPEPGEEVIIAENKPEEMPDYIDDAVTASNEADPDSGEEPVEDFDNNAMLAPEMDPIDDTVIDDPVIDA